MSITIKQLKDFIDQYPEDWIIKELNVPSAAAVMTPMGWRNDTPEMQEISILFSRPVKPSGKVYVGGTL